MRGRFFVPFGGYFKALRKEILGDKPLSLAPNNKPAAAEAINRASTFNSETYYSRAPVVDSDFLLDLFMLNLSLKSNASAAGRWGSAIGVRYYSKKQKNVLPKLGSNVWLQPFNLPPTGSAFGNLTLAQMLTILYLGGPLEVMKRQPQAFTFWTYGYKREYSWFLNPDTRRNAEAFWDSDYRCLLESDLKVLMAQFFVSDRAKRRSGLWNRFFAIREKYTAEQTLKRGVFTTFFLYLLKKKFR
jgi:hypothetical protein